MSLDTSALIPALEGGALIGVAAGTLYLVTGRIAGVSGIFSNAVLRRPEAWRWLFVAGLVLAGLGARWLHVSLPHSLASPLGATTTGLPASASFPWLLVLAGLLVGFGTRLGNGCTSGHGVCGLARLSPRSLSAVLVFILTAAATVYVTRHLAPGLLP